MSSEIVAVPVGAGIVTGGILALPLLGAAAVLYGAARIVKDHVDREIEKELSILAREQQQQDDWQKRNEKITSERKALAAVRESLDEIISDCGNVPAISRKDVVMVAADNGKVMTEINNHRSIGEITRMIESAIVQIEEYYMGSTTTATSSLSHLLTIANNFRQRLNTTRSLTIKEAESFASTIIYAIKCQQNAVDCFVKEQEKMTGEVEILAKKAALLYRLTSEARLKNEIRGIKANIHSLKTKELRPLKARVSSLLQTAEEKVKREVVGRAAKSATEEVVVNHLRNMGYRLVKGPRRSTGHFFMEIPGGEYLETTIDGDGKLQFDVRHEAHDSRKPLTSEDELKFRSQEKRWCEDAPRFFTLLADDGFTYAITSERSVQTIITVETVDEIEKTEELRRNEDHQRILRLKNQPKAKGMQR